MKYPPNSHSIKPCAKTIKSRVSCLTILNHKAETVQQCFGIKGKKRKKKKKMLPWLQTSHSGWGEQRVVDPKQEKKQHLPCLSGHTGGVTGEFLHCREHLLTQLEVHRAEVLRPGRHTNI